MIGRKSVVIVFSASIFWLCLNLASAESTTRNFTLKPGWSIVFLEVEPPSTAPSDVFAVVADLEPTWQQLSSEEKDILER
jgi:hypothetical protein